MLPSPQKLRTPGSQPRRWIVCTLPKPLEVGRLQRNHSPLPRTAGRNRLPRRARILLRSKRCPETGLRVRIHSLVPSRNGTECTRTRPHQLLRRPLGVRALRLSSIGMCRTRRMCPLPPCSRSLNGTGSIPARLRQLLQRAHVLRALPLNSAGVCPIPLLLLCKRGPRFPLLLTARLRRIRKRTARRTRLTVRVALHSYDQKAAAVFAPNPQPGAIFGELTQVQRALTQCEPQDTTPR